MNKKAVRLLQQVVLVHLLGIVLLVFWPTVEVKKPMHVKVVTCHVQASTPTKERQKPPVAKRVTAKHEETKVTSLRDKAAQALEKIQKNQPSSSRVSPLKGVASLAVESNFSDRGYIDELVERLQLLLKLPEYGEVTVQVTLDPLGSIVDFHIQSSKSLINQKYVQEKLPHLQLPKFSGELYGEKEHTFILVLHHSADGP